MPKDESEFDFQKALKAIQSGKPLTGKDGVLAPLIKNLTEAALEGELDSHLAREIAANRRNGKSKKTIKSLKALLNLTPRVIALAHFHPSSLKNTKRPSAMRSKKKS